ncbi:Vms1/Ankzf1 family peptidyl-tRNA hydrolase [Sanguibacter massiliensis]|uniref:baeRF2 domain-containing protein n=1 Tax=Sanguibacter massiliensis TaxID=1973217 RepID=UPI000C841388|nr:Vms1/Ankzf1 family peptidyl-tRNA hydrolase [Sanguibacter massiliensis]
MLVDWIRPLLGRPGPFTSVHLDVSRAGGRHEREIAERWRPLRRILELSDTPAELLGMLDDAVAIPIRDDSIGGRLLVATDVDGILVDRPLVTSPPSSRVARGATPDLLPAAVYSDEAVDHVVVTVDRAGADLVRRGWGSSDVAWQACIDGERADITQPGHGGISESRAVRRTQDAWSRNAHSVASVVDRLVATDGPEIIVLTGDTRAVGLVGRALGSRARALVVEIPGGSRGATGAQDIFEARLRGSLESHRVRRRAAVVARLTEGLALGRGALTGLDAVVRASREGRVAELVLETTVQRTVGEGPLVWAGDDWAALSLTPDVLVAQGEPHLREMDAVIAVLRAAIGQDAGVSFVEPGTAPLVDGIGAILRWDVAEPQPRASTGRGRGRPWATAYV